MHGVACGARTSLRFEGDDPLCVLVTDPPWLISRDLLRQIWTNVFQHVLCRGFPGNFMSSLVVRKVVVIESVLVVDHWVGLSPCSHDCL